MCVCCLFLLSFVFLSFGLFAFLHDYSIKYSVPTSDEHGLVVEAVPVPVLGTDTIYNGLLEREP